MQEIDHTMTAEEIRDLVGESPLMLEIGCHDGSDTEKFLAAMPGARIYCFEPYAQPASRFQARLGGDQRVTLIKMAIGAVDDRVPFNPSTGKVGDREDWDLSGSLQEPTGHLIRSPEILFKDPIEVECVRLDSWWTGFLWHPGTQDVIEASVIDFVWADVQGAQRAMIAGGALALVATHYLYIECHQEPQYQDEPSQEELIGLLPSFESMARYARENILFRNKSFP